MLMGMPKTELFLSKCQVDTPVDVVEGMWKLVSQYRTKIKRVVDFGAGDGRFSRFGKYNNYIGYEVDPARLATKGPLPSKATLELACAFESNERGYDLCIGNPPYVRHHDIESNWQTTVISKLSQESGVKIDARANAFTLFMMKALLATSENGLVALLVPYEWVSRPSCAWLRDYISKHSWGVRIYKFSESLFPRVLTTASITIIDKSLRTAQWEYFRLDREFASSKMRLPTGSRSKVIEYTRRKETNYAQRGLSPGGQKVFCLTEGERLHFGLQVGRDVTPCVTSLKDISYDMETLSEREFKLHFLTQGKKCWLIKPRAKPSKALASYIESIPFEDRDNYTTRNQTPWWCYREHSAPDILYASSFTSWGPKVVLNDIGAVALGSVHGVHGVHGIRNRELIEQLKAINFEKQIVHHSGKLKKIEVNQMNTVLNEIVGLIDESDS